MTTTIDEVIPNERGGELLAPKRHRHEKREERTDIKSFAEAEPGPKPLGAFDAPPAPVALPLTW